MQKLKGLLVALMCLATLLLVMLTEDYDDSINHLTGTLPFNWYSVFASSTPGEKNHRGYDYAFYLPLTALAWERFGFKSVVQIIGTRIEWERSRPLSWILSHLEARRVTILFIDAINDQRPSLGQTARIFTANFAGFPGQPDDYLITSDADLWPLHKEHYTPKENMKIVLVHGHCCGFFSFNGSMYRMYPMSNIGATVKTWRQIMNDGNQYANDSDSIVQYLEGSYGPKVRVKPIIGDQNWYLDQLVVSVRIQHWINEHGNKNVHMVSDQGFDRVDRPRWKSDVDKCLANQSFYEKMYDAHLPGSPFMPDVWNMMKPLVHLMYGVDSWQAAWADDYAKGFHRIMNETRLL